LSIGIIYLLTLIFPKLYVQLNCDPCDAVDADYCLVINNEGEVELCEIQRKNFFKKNLERLSFSLKKDDLADSPYLGKDYSNISDENIVIQYRNNNYIYLEDEKAFTSIRFELHKFNHIELHKNFGRGITNVKEYCYSLNKYGLNQVFFQSKSFFNIFMSQFLHPLYLYQVYSIADFFYIGYYSFASIILVLIIIILFVNSYQQYMNYSKILSFSLQSFKVEILRYLVLLLNIRM
jgi:cation-transporting ATPase 13A2